MRAAPVVHSQRMSTAAAATAAVVSSRALEARADSCEASSDATLIIMATFATRPHHCSVTFAAMYFFALRHRADQALVDHHRQRLPSGAAIRQVRAGIWSSFIGLFSFVFVFGQEPLLRGRAFRADRMLRLAGIVRKKPVARVCRLRDFLSGIHQAHRMVDHPMSGRTITIVHILLWFRTMRKIRV